MRPFSSARSRTAPEVSRGDLVLRGLCVGAGLLVVATLVAVLYEIIRNAEPAIRASGLGFLGHTTWAPNLPGYHFGAGALLFGTAVSSTIALLIAMPISVGIGLYLAMLAPKWVRSVVGPLVEMLAAIPSVVLGFFGITVLGPFMAKHVEGPLHTVLGFTGLFGAQRETGLSLFMASLVLSVMIIPIIASLSRDLYLSVPSELTDGAEALGATRWEVIRGIVIPSTFSGVMSAVMLGMGRALGEALAVAMTIGGGLFVASDLFGPGQSLAAQIATHIEFPTGAQETNALYYLALILLVIGVVTNLVARAITRRYSIAKG